MTQVFKLTDYKCRFICPASGKKNITQEFLKRYFQLKRDVTNLNGSNIYDFLLYYEKHKPSIHPEVAWKIIFYKLPELCFSRQLEDSTVVSEVLLTIHHFSKAAISPVVLFIALNSLRQRTLPEEVLCKRKKEGKASFSFLAFFLYHSNARKLTFDGKRITEMMEGSNPILYTRFLVFADSRCLLTLIQYGLRFDSSRDRFKMHSIFLYFLQYMKELSFKIERLLTNNAYRNLLCMFSNLKLILRSTYNPQNIVDHMVALFVKESDFEKSRDIISLSDLEVPVQYLPTLQHLCRYAIRESLFANWRLPLGIRHLPLKPDLANYIYLCAD